MQNDKNDPTTNTGPSEVPRLLTRQQVADALQVSVGSIDCWIKKGRLRASRLGGPGGAVRIDPSDLAAFVDAGKGGAR